MPQRLVIDLATGQETVVDLTPEEIADRKVIADQAAADEVKQVNAVALRDKAALALAANAQYLALATPTAAQTGAQVQRLTRQVNALARLLAGQTDTTSDT